MAQSAAVGFLILGIFLICLAPSIVWVVIGSHELNNPCNRQTDTPNFAVWLIITGSVEIFACILLSVLPLLGFIVAHYIISVVFNMFFLGWLIIGAFRLSQDTACEAEQDQRLYNTMLAAVIIGFVGIFFRICQTKGTAKNNDDD